MGIRNLAIIAHVDHGKTTLIDGLFKNSGVFQSHKSHEDRVMDSGDIEKERGITITAKNASFEWKGEQINIVDTPGHADFGGEVERALYMVDGALLLVDAAEGPLPQTRFVLSKALQRGIKIICVINKVDRPDARIDVVEDMLMELFYDLAKSDEQASYTTLYASAKEGWASLSKTERKEDFTDLLDKIVEEIPPPKVDPSAPFRLLVTNLRYSPYVGQMSVGRIESGKVRLNERINLIDRDGKAKNFQVSRIETFSGLGSVEVESLEAGNIALISGMENPKIGDTLSHLECFEPLPRIEVDPPTVSIRLSINTSPFSGQDGNYATTRKLEELLESACLKNVAIQYEKTDSADVFLLKARGELQIVVLLEELRREGWEFMAGRPEVIPVEIDGEIMEPEEIFHLDLPETMVGIVTPLLSERGGRMEQMEALEGSGRVRLQFRIPARGLIGIRSRLLTETRGEAIFSSSSSGYIPYQGRRLSRSNGALVCDRNGRSTEYALHELQSRGRLFFGAGLELYEGMIFGENSRSNDLNCNATKSKKLTNMRASGTDESTKLSGFRSMNLEESLEWIDEDEWVEITPKAVRLRKHELRSNFRKTTRV